MPLIVLTHGRLADSSERPPGWPIIEEERIWRQMHAELARMVPNGRHIVAEGVGHDIHHEQPDFVNDAVRQMVAAVRDPSTWAMPTANPATTPGS
jgi:hypothetical protein